MFDIAIGSALDSLEQEQKLTNELMIELDELKKIIKGCIILDPNKDPDPYGFHGMSLKYRFDVMKVEHE